MTVALQEEPRRGTGTDRGRFAVEDSPTVARLREAWGGQTPQGSSRAQCRDKS